MHDAFKPDVFGSRHKTRSRDTSICLEAKVQSNGIGFAANKARTSMGKSFHELHLLDQPPCAADPWLLAFALESGGMRRFGEHFVEECPGEV